MALACSTRFEIWNKLTYRDVRWTWALCCRWYCLATKSIVVLGPGCVRCRRVKANVDLAVKQSGIDATVEHVTDMQKILAYDVLATPALIVDGRTLVVGRVPPVAEIVQLLTGPPSE